MKRSAKQCGRFIEYQISEYLNIKLAVTALLLFLFNIKPKISV